MSEQAQAPQDKEPPRDHDGRLLTDYTYPELIVRIRELYTNNSNMLVTWADDIFPPPNEQGQVVFGRACLESVAIELRYMLDAFFEVIAREQRVRSAQASAAARDVMAERARQIAVEGWTEGHDDDHQRGELATAAACYALHVAGKCEMTPAYGNQDRGGPWVPELWPWALKWWKPKDGRRDLVRAGALILAEIERLDRAQPSGGEK